MTARLVLGVDPGGAGNHGFVVLRVAQGGAAAFVVAGVWGDDPGALVGAVGAVALVAVETPLVLHTPQASRQLLATAKAAGAFGQAARDRGLAVVELHPGKWRGVLCGAASPSDAVVKRAILAHVRGWPARSTSHARDAAGVALVAARGPWPESGKVGP